MAYVAVSILEISGISRIGAKKPKGRGRKQNEKVQGKWFVCIGFLSVSGMRRVYAGFRACSCR